jgi:hypothetical protein
MSWGLWANFGALLFGIGAVIALYISATDADKRIAGAEAEAAKANERASVASERAANLEKQAAQLRLDLEKERAYREPRTLSPTQQSAVAQKIHPFAGTGFVAYVQLAPEPIGFLVLLEGVLTAAGWQPHPPAPPAPTLTLPNLVPVGQSLSFIGIRVWFDGRGNPSLKPAAEALGSALNAETISTALDDEAFTDGNDPSFVLIQIGEKPRVYP